MSVQKSPCLPIVPADIDWQTDDLGHVVPVSRQFGDVYFSKVNGLAEAHYVFIKHNQLPQRFDHLYAIFNQSPTKPSQTFIIAELGFGTGLNFFATWLLWRQIRQKFLSQFDDNKDKAKLKFKLPRLQFISFEKHPLTHADLSRALQDWQTSQPNLAPLIDEFLANYPPLVAGCHRLSFADDALTLDLWLGDASDNLKLMALHTEYADKSFHNQQPQGQIHAWYLDGFAPACNQSLWADDIFAQIKRLSAPHATLATFSCAAVVKRGLTAIGFKIAKVKGFGHKREMLTAVFPPPKPICCKSPYPPKTTTPNKVLVIGAGISGLMSAWALANRGINVMLVDKTAPLAGASGNPRAVLSPKIVSLSQISDHLHSMGYLYGIRFYQQLQKNQASNLSSKSHLPIFEQTGVMDTLVHSRATAQQIMDYPDDFAMMTDDAYYHPAAGKNMACAYFPKAGLVNPQALAQHILAHPLIDYQTTFVTNLSHTTTGISIDIQHGQPLTADAVVICAAYDSCLLHKNIFDYRKIRGQVSWFAPNAKQWQYLPKLPMKYGGYCTPFTTLANDDNYGHSQDHKPLQKLFLLGASFVRNDTATDIRPQEHADNVHKLTHALADAGLAFDDDTNWQGRDWQGRASIRAQTPDYHPVVGVLINNHNPNSIHHISHMWTMSGMGSKGFAFAPLCSELLADMMTHAIAPMPAGLIAKLASYRKRLQTPLND